uniref:Uncharacterized protein n=1 Tax=Anopheles atroparvus TaxID=41427 RepID=A0A182IWJ9_ANOAO
MMREILPILAYMSVLSSTYSLHMARDAYIKPPPPPPPAQLLDDLDDMSELLAENSVDLMRSSAGGGMRTMMGSVHQKLGGHLTHNGGGGVGGGAGGSSSSATGGNAGNGMLSMAGRHVGGGVGAVEAGVVHGMTSNELPELSPPPAHLMASGMRHGPIGPLVGQPPRGLQELFGVQTNFDIRAAQQQLSREGPHGRTPSYGITSQSAASGTSSGGSSSMDDRDEDDNGGEVDDGTSGGAGNTDQQQQQQQQRQQQQEQPQRSAASNKRASPTGARNKMMADSAQDSGAGSSLPSIPHGIANQLMLRSTRGQRQYDVPQIAHKSVHFTPIEAGRGLGYAERIAPFTTPPGTLDSPVSTAESGNYDSV